MRAPGWAGAAKRSRLRVGGRFFLAVGIVLLSVLAVTTSGAVGLVRMKAQIDQSISDNLRTSEETTSLQLALDGVDKVALEQINSVSPSRRAVLDQALDERLIPAVQLHLETVAGLIAADPHGNERIADISNLFNRYLALRRAGAYDATPAPSAGAATTATAATAATVASQTADLFGQMDAVAQTIRQIEVHEAGAAERAAERTYLSTLRDLIGGAVGSLLLGLTVVLLLIRSLVPRIRGYSHFAAQIAAGEETEMLQVHGNDELSDLGSALNDMVAARHQVSSYETSQAEFIETLQFTSSESEAHELLKRHLERSLTDSRAVVFISNNSGNRLEAATPWSEQDEALAERVVGAEPRACVAMRLGRTHREGDENQLLECGVCAGGAGRSTCEPLQVSGEVIGSVLVNHPGVLGSEQSDRVSLSVAQAAPVLANLRNLTLAQFRANNDSLTGLPNKRASEDTFKRMVAQAQRTLMPLSAIMLDLDHFKQVNDLYGHEKGDEVLAATGLAISSCLRDSDFAGRFGGEEFLVLLPDTGSQGAQQFGERLRQTIASIEITGFDRGITASLGIAELLELGGTPRGLLREADRALYAAKAGGRDRVVVAQFDDASDASAPDAVATDSVATDSVTTA
jgi:diguanylate cyclase (GGDEF)-like protein